MTRTSSRYQQAWESYWQDTPAQTGAAIWDSPPEEASALHAARFGPHLDTSLPVVDLGCGSGTQTRHLAGRFARAIGVDLSASAVEHARAADPGGLAEYRVLDATDPDAVRALSEELGDACVYMRGILHQSEPGDRPAVVRSVATLLGERGAVFCVEMAAASKPLLRALAAGEQGPVPKLDSVFSHGLTPSEVADEAVPELFRSVGLTVLDRGEVPLYTTELLADGQRLELPMTWLVAGRARS
ncbi:class I SAM-dependent methyltransferase [Streptomyces capparidis]